MKRWTKLLSTVIGLAIIACAGFITWRVWPRTQHVYTDADTIHTPQEKALVRDILWTPPTRLPDSLNSAGDDYEPEHSTDGRTLLFVRGKAGRNADIYTCNKIADGWSEPAPLDTINTEHDELGPELSPDGSALYFYSDRPGGLGGYDLWIARRSEEGWLPATHLGSHVNSEYNDYGPALSPDGDRLYFSSNRPRTDEANPPAASNWPATLREQHHEHDYDIYLCTIGDQGIGRANPVVEVNSPYHEGSPSVSPFGDFLYFSSNRPGGLGGYDLYRTRRLRGNHETPSNLGPSINSAANELDADLSLGGYGLYFSSDRRAGTTPAADAPPDYNIYHTTSREVFRQEDTRRASIDWAALWRTIGPNLMWALLALILSLLMFALLRDFREGKMSLLMRCLLASLLLHMLLMLLFNVWEVTTSLAGFVRDRGRIQVALINTAAADEIAGQLRGQWTQIETPVAPTEPIEPPDPPRVDEPIESMITLDVRQNSIPRDSQPIVEDVLTDAPIPDPETDLRNDATSIEIALDRTTPAELALPPDTNPIDSKETDYSIPTPIAQSAMPRPVLPAPTTQPTTDGYEFTPIRRDVTESESDPLTSTLTAIPADANIPFEKQSPSPTTAESVTHPMATLPELSTPIENQRINTAEPHPTPTPGRIASPQINPPPLPVDPTEPSPDSRNEPIVPLRVATIEIDNTPLVAPDDSNQTEDAPPPSRPDWPTNTHHSAESVTVNLVGLSLPRDDHHPTDNVEESLHPADSIAIRLARPDVNDTTIPPGASSTTPVWAKITPASGSRSTAVEISRDRLELNDAEATTDHSLQAKPIETGPALSSSPSFDLALPSTATPINEFTVSTPDSPQASYRETDRFHALMPQWPNDDTHSRMTPIELAPTPAKTMPGISPLLAQSKAIPRDASIENRPILTPDGVPTIAVRVSPGKMDLNIPTEVEIPWYEKLPPGAVGLIRGRVTEAESEHSLPDATIRLVLPDDETLAVLSDETGRYELAVPPVPKFFAVSASLESYIPESVNVPRSRLRRGPITLHFRLEPQREDVIALEAEPDVHHLGNNRFEGRINSQFQNRSEGKRYRASFTISDAQLKADYAQAEVRLMAKGVQCPHQIRINGRLLHGRLNDSPRDGSFGDFAARFDPTWLTSGVNRFKITAKSCRGDLDDFEFVNIRIIPTP